MLQLSVNTSPYFDYVIFGTPLKAVNVNQPLVNQDKKFNICPNILTVHCQFVTVFNKVERNLHTIMEC